MASRDHAGIETQFVFEKTSKEGKSRFNYDRQTLYQMIWDFVEQNRKLNQFQTENLVFPWIGPVTITL